MIRPATVTDLDGIEETYREHFAHEKEYGAYTVFQEGVYPTRKEAEKALISDALFVYEENGSVMGSIIFDDIQPEEYKRIAWPSHAPDERIRVVHLLMVRPGTAGKGIGSALINYVTEMAVRQSCEAIRLDTGAQNIPAVSLYKKLGFQLAAASSMKVGGMISHESHLFFEKSLRSNDCKDGDGTAL